MEPPAKRLRILQSVQVDEDNADYVEAKQKQQKKLKNTMESIFAKYENMHESMSDIIDMKANKVVVDRGHLRRLQRQAHRSETTLLDAVGLSASKYDDASPDGLDDDNDAGKEASEDELAPPQCPTSSRKEQPLPTPVAQTQPTPQQIPQTPGPAANLLQLVQFPQTPAGQQAQHAFYATLTHTINQAVQQAVAPLFSQVLPNTQSIPWPTLQAPRASPVVTTPFARADTVAPATDPKWSFPPLPVELPEAQKKDSSPPRCSDPTAIPCLTTTNLNEPQKWEEEAEQPGPRETQTSQVQSSHPESGTSPWTRSASGRRSPRVVVHRKGNSRAPSYLFTEEEDRYISKRRMHDKSSWADIRDSQEKWKTWPLRAFQKRWDEHLKVRKRDPETPKSRPCMAYTTPNEDKESAVRVNHLPTPSSSRHEDPLDNTVEPETIPSGKDDVQARAGCYDDDDLELLSMAGDDDRGNMAVSDDDVQHAEPVDVVLPSIETAIDIFQEDAIQQHLLEKAPTVEPRSNFNIGISSRTQRANRGRPPLNLLQSVPGCKAESKIPSEQTTSSPNVNTPAHQEIRRSTSIDLVGEEDDLLAPVTPHIKRESSTPLPPSFLCSTPIPRPHTHLLSSNAKSASKVSNKAFRKQVKQSWTRMGTPGARAKSKALEKRKSFPMLGTRKRGWRGSEAGSEDELAM